MSQIFDIAKLRALQPAIVCIGGHNGIIQSVLDFDYLSGKPSPSIVAIIAAGRSLERFYFGDHEVAIPVYPSAEAMPAASRDSVDLLLNVASGRRVLDNIETSVRSLPNVQGATVFAEGMPERHALRLSDSMSSHGIWVAGAASVGVIVPGVFKLGAIGGIQPDHLQASNLLDAGSVAVVSSSGGMVNELIRSVAAAGWGVSFAVALGGERYPMLTPADVLLAAEADPATKAIAYFGELGGEDEYELANLIKTGRVTKPVLAYIAGSVADLFAEPPQFGHAKAMASRRSESAVAKRAVLNEAGAQASATYGQFIKALDALPGVAKQPVTNVREMPARRSPALFVNGISHDENGDVKVLGQDLLGLASDNSFAAITIGMLLGRPATSPRLHEFIDFCLRLLVDHGPYVSGAINTMVTARAGRDMVSALASGLLTVGPRFGGAINQAAATWYDGVERDVSAAMLVEEFASQKRYISGIGHRKYRTDKPDPRVGRLLSFADDLDNPVYTGFARAVAAETSAKKANLILNVDGAIAAVMLDLLAEAESLSADELRQAIDIELFNAIFVLARSVGFMAHYYDQRRHDEGLFRLGPDDVLPL